MLYVVLTMPTLNKAYLFIYLFIIIMIVSDPTEIRKNLTILLKFMKE
jgi:hypothetical protein